MREIEFRAKGLYKDRWYYGYYVEHKRSMQNYIIDLDEEVMNTEHLVDKNTLGQYTGIKDKNGTKIFEGDIVKGNFPYAKIGKIIWDKKRCGMYVKPISIFGRAAYDKYYKLNSCSLEVVGNIYDNPELVGKVEG